MNQSPPILLVGRRSCCGFHSGKRKKPFPKLELRMMKFLAFSKLVPPSKMLIKPSGFHHSSAQTGLRDRLSAARAFSISCKELLAGSANHWRKLTVAWHPEKTMATVSPVFPNKGANREKVAPYKTIMEAKGFKTWKGTNRFTRRIDPGKLHDIYIYIFFLKYIIHWFTQLNYAQLRISNPKLQFSMFGTAWLLICLPNCPSSHNHGSRKWYTWYTLKRIWYDPLTLGPTQFFIF